MMKLFLPFTVLFSIAYGAQCAVMDVLKITTQVVPKLLLPQNAFACGANTAENKMEKPTDLCVCIAILKREGLTNDVFPDCDFDQLGEAFPSVNLRKLATTDCAGVTAGTDATGGTAKQINFASDLNCVEINFPSNCAMADYLHKYPERFKSISQVMGKFGAGSDVQIGQFWTSPQDATAVTVGKGGCSTKGFTNVLNCADNTGYENNELLKNFKSILSGSQTFDLYCDLVTMASKSITARAFAKEGAEIDSAKCQKVVSDGANNNPAANIGACASSAATSMMDKISKIDKKNIQTQTACKDLMAGTFGTVAELCDCLAAMKASGLNVDSDLQSCNMDFGNKAVDLMQVDTSNCPDTQIPKIELKADVTAKQLHFKTDDNNMCVELNFPPSCLLADWLYDHPELIKNTKGLPEEVTKAWSQNKGKAGFGKGNCVAQGFTDSLDCSKVTADNLPPSMKDYLSTGWNIPCDVAAGETKVTPKTYFKDTAALVLEGKMAPDNEPNEAMKKQLQGCTYGKSSGANPRKVDVRDGKSSTAIFGFVAFGLLNFLL